MNIEKPPFNAASKDSCWSPEINYRTEPHKYCVGKGTDGVHICQPYASLIGQYWQLETTTRARQSSETILEMFLAYWDTGDFVGADMARKFLQLGLSRSRRRASYLRRERKRIHNVQIVADETEATEIAALFFRAWQRAEFHPGYKLAKFRWKQLYG